MPAPSGCLPASSKFGDMFAESAVAILNHLLAQGGWAPQRLAAFNGMSVRINLFPFSFVCAIREDGMLRNAPPGTREYFSG